jgi:dihydrolipoamide dehydrogenase
MVSDYDDAGQVRWLADSGIDLLRGNGRIVERGIVDVDGRGYRAEHIVVAEDRSP